MKPSLDFNLITVESVCRNPILALLLEDKKKRLESLAAKQLRRKQFRILLKVQLNNYFVLDKFGNMVDIAKVKSLLMDPNCAYSETFNYKYLDSLGGYLADNNLIIVISSKLSPNLSIIQDFQNIISFKGFYFVISSLLNRSIFHFKP